MEIRDLASPTRCDDAPITDLTFSLLEGPPVGRGPPDRSWDCKSGIWQAVPPVMTVLSQI